MFALYFQEPWLKQGVALCLGGDEGSGKSFIFVEVIGYLLGPNFAHLQSMEEVVGNFNAVMKDKLLVFIDECLFAGNQQHANIVKNLITGNDQRVREMFKDTNYKESFLNLAFASNLSWFINAGTNARRYLILKSNPEQLLQFFAETREDIKDKLTYFSSMIQKLKNNDNEGLKTFQNYLQNLPLGNFDPRQVPITRHLVRQKINSLVGIERFWFDCLHNKTVCRYKDNQTREEKNITWNQDVELRHIISYYNEKYGNKYSNKNQIFFFQELRELEPGITTYKNKTLDGNRNPIEQELVKFPPVKVCRKNFASRVPGIELVWEENFLEDVMRLPLDKDGNIDPKPIYNLP
jgi:hypothetical protein